jgi:hypothetical protein
MGCHSANTHQFIYHSYCYTTLNTHFIYKESLNKAYRGAEVHLHTFLTSAQRGGEWLASRLGQLTPRKEQKFPLSGLRVGLAVSEYKKISCL